MPIRAAVLLLMACLAAPAPGQWVTRDERWQPRGPWNWAVQERLPDLYAEFNGIDFGHAHLAETLLETNDPARVERARQDVLRFIFSEPEIPPDEDLISPTFSRLAWELRRTFNWAHTFHRSLYDLFASDGVKDKDGVYRRLLADYLAKPQAITSHALDHHGKLMGFPESGVFRAAFPEFNSQIWSYHWLQAAAYDVQLMGDAARQRSLFPPVISQYHEYLRNPPVEWEFMPMMHEAAPEFTRRFPEAANIFDNLHMLHDNVDDILSSPDRYATNRVRRDAILAVLAIYLHRNHSGRNDRYAEYRTQPPDSGEAAPAEHGEHDAPANAGRPPSAAAVLDAAGMGHENHERPAGPRTHSPVHLEPHGTAGA